MPHAIRLESGEQLEMEDAVSDRLSDGDHVFGGWSLLYSPFHSSKIRCSRLKFYVGIRVPSLPPWRQEQNLHGLVSREASLLVPHGELSSETNTFHDMSYDLGSGSPSIAAPRGGIRNRE